MTDEQHPANTPIDRETLEQTKELLLRLQDLSARHLAIGVDLATLASYIQNGVPQHFREISRLCTHVETLALFLPACHELLLDFHTLVFPSAEPPP